MKFSTFVAFICALVVHLLLLLLLVVNVSLDKPQRPQDAGVKIMHATVITPPAKGKETGSAQNIKKPQETVKKNTDDSKRKAQEEALKKRVEAQKKAEEQRVLALKKKQEEQKKLEEKKRKEAEAKAKAEAEAKAKAEAEAKAKAEAEAKAKAEAEAKKKAQEEKERLEKEAKEKAEAEAKRLEQEAMEAQKKLEAQQEAALLEQELLGTADGVEGGEGLGSDLLASRLDRQNVANYMVAVAGAIRTKGVNPKGEPWKVGIEDPLAPGSTPFAVVCPQGMAMSTSGTYRNFFIDEKTNERFSHIIDPQTGKPINHRTVSVTVIAPSALTTDTLDTGLMVMGADKALKWAEENEVPIYTVEINEKGEAVGRYSRYMEPYLKCELPKDRVGIKE